MKKALIMASACILLAACDGTGSSILSSRMPKGNPNAAVVIWNYTDLQCPACRAAHSGISVPLMEEFGNDIAFHFMHFPLRTIHRYSMDASMASECAADQGKFWQYVDLVFEKQLELESGILFTWADELGLNDEKFKKCLSSGEKRSIVLSDFARGRELGVGGTPTFFINGVRVQSNLDSMRMEIKEELERLTKKL